MLQIDSLRFKLLESLGLSRYRLTSNRLFTSIINTRVKHFNLNEIFAFPLTPITSQIYLVIR